MVVGRLLQRGRCWMCYLKPMNNPCAKIQFFLPLNSIFAPVKLTNINTSQWAASINMYFSIIHSHVQCH